MAEDVLLVALDGSPFGSAVLPYAEAIAHLTQQRLRLFSVVGGAPSGHSLTAVQFAARREQDEHRRITHYLAETAAAVRARGLTVSTVVVFGDPIGSILAEADKAEVALVALSTQGRSGLDRWAMGSVADKVMRLSPKPTLLVRPPYIPLPKRAVTLRSVLVPLDGSSLAEVALPLARRFLGIDPTLWLVRVEPWLTEGSAPYGTISEFTQMEDEAEAEAAAYLTRVKEQLGAVDRVRTSVLRGRPAQSLVDFAFHEHIDLTVMTTRGAGGISRLIHGSTADFLVRSGIPTVLVRPEIARDENASS